jgi:peptidoglycan/LPS O-acetylase OafA/YrhL
MSSRKVPPLASSRLDLASRRASANIAAPVSEVSAAASSRFGMFTGRGARLTWLSDMMTADKNSFGVVRLLLALAVLVSHSIYLTTGRGELEPLYRYTNYTLGQHGVQIFFFLSGILVAQSLFASRSVHDYAIARALRILPALIACVLVTALIVGPLLTTLPPMMFLKDQGVAAYIAKTISLWSGSAQMPGLFQDNPVPRVVNTSVWTLKYEALCYVVLGLVGWLVIKANRWRETAFALAALWLAAVFLKPVGLELHGGAKSTIEVFRYFTIFFGAGVLAYACRHYIPVNAVVMAPLAVVFWAAIGTRFQEPAAAVFLGYLAIWIATFRFGGFRDFTNENDYSYATYLYHMPVAQVLLHIWPNMSAVPLILATTGIVIWIAFLSWELIERPALALRKRFKQPLPAAAETTFDQALTAAKSAANATTAIVSAAVATPRVIAKGPLPIVRDKAVTVAEIAAARASERVLRQMAGSPAPVTAETVSPDKAQVAVSPAATPSAASSAAHVWRPMPAVKRLQIQTDDTPAAAAATLEQRPRPSMPLDLINRATAAMPSMPFKRETTQPAASAVDQPALPQVPASRIAFVTKRRASADATTIMPAAAPVAPAESSRAVVPVYGDMDELDRATAPRVSQPRPKWTRPIGAPVPG